MEHLEFKQFFTSGSHYNSQKVNQNFAVLMKNGDIVGNDNYDEKLFKFSQLEPQFVAAADNFRLVKEDRSEESSFYNKSYD